MVFKEDYPRHPPTVTFLSDTVFHPLISQDGKMSLKARFRTWMLVTISNQSPLHLHLIIWNLHSPQEHHVFDVLHAIKAAFKKDVLDHLEEKNCLNHEAYKYEFHLSSSLPS
jgi:ubiquitin-protein ligase